MGLLELWNYEVTTVSQKHEHAEDSSSDELEHNWNLIVDSYCLLGL